MRKNIKKTLATISALLAFSLPFSVFATTSTYNPAAGNTSPMDGLVESDGFQSFATARANTTGFYASATDNSKAFAAAYEQGGETQLLRSVTCYNTASIPDGASISAATVTVYLYGDITYTYTYNYGTSAFGAITTRTGAEDYLVLTDYSGQQNTISNSDYNTFGSTKFSSDFDFSALSLDADNTFTLNSSGISHINKTGVTCFGMRTGNDFDNVAYSTGTNYEIWGNDSGSTTVAGPTFVSSHEPTLSVTYTSGTPPTISTSSLADGLVSSSYSESLSATGGSTPYTWSVLSGSLPSGLSLSSGVISGTPTASGSFGFVIQVAGSDSATATKSFTIAVSADTARADFLNDWSLVRKFKELIDLGIIASPSSTLDTIRARTRSEYMESYITP